MIVTAILLVLTACTPAGTATETAAGPDGAGAITESAPMSTPLATEAAGGGEPAANCAGVDTQQLMTTGQTVFTDRCASCHGAQGEGQGDFPALAASPAVTVENVMDLVTTYLSVEAHPKDVTPDDLAAVLTYVRGSFGNTAAAVCPADVQIPAAQ